ncbi:related to mouse T10 protein [Ramularia collo-cygni]|uniref:Related to mouse T10 protein n=1 Tax=Ramularia collo-cygni TaxID=112498 RepID=A0A2D3V7K1_9PEZI|nr:related to mouse T10 protein [Ramularia collo-cygni]CZT16333.1 related to mouse T10 protein [Ramularia collo-cygni]
MCISVLSTAHPQYALVLISNRDEFVHRPTLRADWWDPPHQQVLGGRDLQRQERGTWLGITKQGRIAILTNFREEGVNENGQKSRGAMVNSYLTVPPDVHESEDEFAQRLINNVGIHDVGGFTLLFGKLERPKSHNEPSEAKDLPGLAVISNRTDSAKGLRRIATKIGETHGLSNSHYGDNTWPKVVNGEKKLMQAISDDIPRNDSQSEFVEDLLAILCDDSLPDRRNDETWDEYVRHMRKSIMIPAIKGKAAHQSPDAQPDNGDRSLVPGSLKLTPGVGAYGTTKQTVILVDHEGMVTFVERTLYDDSGAPLPNHERDRRIEFKIEGWERQ